MRYDSPDTITIDLISALEWPDSQYARLCTQQKTGVLLHALETSMDRSAEVGLCVRELLNRCDEAGFDRFLSAPSVWQCLTTSWSEGLPSIQRMIDDEIRVLDALEVSHSCALGPGQDISRIDGDWVWDAAGFQAVQSGSAGSARGRVVYRNPLLGGRMFADAISPWTRGPLAEIPTRSDPYSPEDFNSAVSKLRAAVQLLARLSPHALEFVENLTRVVALKCATDYRKGGFVSASTMLCTGRPVLQNPHADFVSVEMLADALVHESIHAAFDAAEYYDTKLPARESDERLESPWTGKPLDPNTYIQACYVWFGLFNLWAGALMSNECCTASAQALFRKTAQGFRDLTFLRRARSRADIFPLEIFGTFEFIAQSTTRTFEEMGREGAAVPPA